MLESYIAQVKRPKGDSSEREAFVSRAAQASAVACKYKLITTNSLNSERRGLHQFPFLDL